MAAWVLVAVTDDEAHRLAASHRMAFRKLREGELIQVPPPDEALRWLEGRRAAAAGRRAIVGAPATVRPAVERLAADYGAGEVIVVTITYDHAARRRSYELLAEAFGLAAGSPPARAA